MLRSAAPCTSTRTRRRLGPQYPNPTRPTLSSCGLISPIEARPSAVPSVNTLPATVLPPSGRNFPANRHKLGRALIPAVRPRTGTAALGEPLSLLRPDDVFKRRGERIRRRIDQESGIADDLRERRPADRHYRRSESHRFAEGIAECLDPRRSDQRSRTLVPATQPRRIAHKAREPDPAVEPELPRMPVERSTFLTRSLAHYDKRVRQCGDCQGLERERVLAVSPRPPDREEVLGGGIVGWPRGRRQHLRHVEGRTDDPDASAEARDDVLERVGERLGDGYHDPRPPIEL